ncbi:MAG TPA: DHA2 family efflux MFS transporter permease subunit [Elusimicrobiota bacterium]|nr:DHA2 family efflux MFS transporter permease subunit [Elusimicrobiota bacterium]
MATEEEQGGWHPGHSPWAVALTVTLATFMEVMDTSIANVALPHIAGGLSASQDEATWVLTSYLVSNAVILPVSGWLSDRFGRKRFYMACVALFTASSFLCGLAPSLGALVVFRVLQGIGGGGLGPSEQAILADTFPASKRGMAFAVYGMAVVLAPAIGPTLGGWITDHISWRWIFFINVPFGALSLFLTSFMVQDPPRMVEGKEKAARQPVDFTGFFLVALGLGAFQFVLDRGQRDDWFASAVITWFVIAAFAALASFVLWELRTEHPVVPVRFFKNRNFSVTCALMLLFFVVLLGMTLLIPQLAQVEMGYSAQKAGELLTPGSLVVLVFLPLAGFLVSRTDARWLMGGGLLVIAAALYHMTSLDLQVSFWTLIWWRMLQMTGAAFLFVPINTIAYTDMPPEANNQVSALVNLMRNMGGSLGISAVTTMLQRRQQVHQAYLVKDVYRDNPRFAQASGQILRRYAVRSGAAQAPRQALAEAYRALQHQAAVLSYVDVIQMLTGVSLAAVVLVFFAKKNKPGQAAAA